LCNSDTGDTTNISLTQALHARQASATSELSPAHAFHAPARATPTSASRSTRSENQATTEKYFQLNERPAWE